MWISVRRDFLAEGTATAKALSSKDQYAGVESVGEVIVTKSGR